MKFLIARPVGFTPEMYEAIRALGLEPVFLPAGADGRPGPEEAAYDGVDFSDIDAVFCYRFFCHNDIARFPRLKYIHTTSHGLDHMPLDYIRAHGIRLCDARGVYGVPMAEYALGGVLQLYKAFPLLAAQQRDRVWRHPETVRELTGRQVTLLGTGSVGTECAKRFSAFGCEVIGLNRTVKPKEYFDEVHPLTELDDLLPTADVVVITVALTEETRGLMTAARIRLMKADAILVNISRGAVIPAQALEESIDQIGGAVLDVFEEEPLSPNSLLWDKQNVLISPHNSFVGEGNAERLSHLVIRHIKNLSV